MKTPESAGRLPWGDKPKIEDGPRRQNVKLGDADFGVRFTGVGAVFNFGEEYKKGRKMGFSTFEAVYMRIEAGNGTSFIQKLTSEGIMSIVVPSEKSHERVDYQLLRGTLEDYKIEVESDGGKKGISEIVVVNWGSVPKGVIGFLPQNSLAMDFESRCEQAA